MSSDDSFSFLRHDPVSAARRLLGCWLVREMDGQRLVGRIVETEAYHQTDAASHSHKGRTPRVEVMFGEPGHAYVYFTYGMHYCMNVVTGPVGEGSAVLIRAVEPIEGIETMKRNRPGVTDKELTNGPAKLCQAFGIDKRLNGHELRQLPLMLRVQPAIDPGRVSQTTRIGIRHNADLPWRFYIRNSAAVSRP